MRSFYYSFYRINSQFNDFLAQKIQKEEKSAMRNLKKILALALALVMSLSLMATANAFTDDDSITDTYETAVTVLSGLKVFQGYDDGSFLPQGAITRAEVAAIIYRIVTGDVADTQVGIYADYNKFDDVASTSWYAGYVNFCANAEYIKGYDARTFGPNDPVTGYQALAMILRALGYDKNGEFTGTNWQVQTAAVGEQRGITKNITAGTLGVAATREVVAEILFQAILVPTVTYTPAFGYTIGDTSLGYKTFGLEDIVGVVVANEYADLYSDSPMKAAALSWMWTARAMSSTTPPPWRTSVRLSTLMWLAALSWPSLTPATPSLRPALPPISAPTATLRTSPVWSVVMPPSSSSTSTTLPSTRPRSASSTTWTVTVPLAVSPSAMVMS